LLNIRRDMNPKVSIIIPVKEINDYVRESMPRILALDYDNYEVIIHVDKKTQESWPKTRIVSGKLNETPPVKREEAIAQARGEIVAFLDDDAYPRADWLKNAVRHFAHPEVGAVYGPGVTPKSDGLWAQVSGEVLSSPLTAWKYTYRYQPAGKLFREEKDLDCRKCSLVKNCNAINEIFTVDDAPTVNLLMRKDVFEKAGGFNTKYWPGEDTKLCLDVVSRQKKKIVYDPDVYVWHHRRDSLYKHFKQNANYAVHRGFFAKKYPETSLLWQYFIPTAFVAFLIVSLVLGFFYPANSLIMWLIWSILILYEALLVIAGIIAGWRQKSFLIGLLTMPIIFATHVVYGIGMVIGLLKPELER